MKLGTYIVYLLRCRDGSYYCGYTLNLPKRLRAHRDGTASKYTRAKLPIRLVYRERHLTQRGAMRREIELKRLSHQQKAGLIRKTRGLRETLSKDN